MPKRFEIVHKRVLNSEMSQISVYAPWIAEKAKPGQFIILRSNENAERIPLTISSHDNGLITVIFPESRRRHDGSGSAERRRLPR